MAERRRILLVNTSDRGGGAERMSALLQQEYSSAGHDVSMAVGFRRGDDPCVVQLDHAAHAASLSQRAGWTVHRRLQPLHGRSRWAGIALRLAQSLAAPEGARDRRAGREDFDFPGTRGIAAATPSPEIIHLQNLHGGYFDLRELPRISRTCPTVWTLHDAWALSGHCAHSLGCQRWQTGCGACPDLTIYPPVRRDATAENWARKRDIFVRSRLHVATPSRWLMNRVEQSQFGVATESLRVIPNGVPLDLFHPGEQHAARAALGLPADARILLFAANGVRGNPFKDFETLRSAVEMLATRWPAGNLLLIALGEKTKIEANRSVPIRFEPPVIDPGRMALFYQAADLYLHAAKADTFPNTILEALACGTPVVATAVGGIPEQLHCLLGPAPFPTGILTPPGDATALAAGAERILRDDVLRQRLGVNAARDARERFDIRTCAKSYLDWFEELLGAQ